MNQSTSTSPVAARLEWPRKVDLFGVHVSCVDYGQAVSCIMQAASDDRSGIVACYSVHAVVTASDDRELREHVNRFSMVTPDGQPVRWALNYFHNAKLADRVYGPELMVRVCQESAARGVSIYLYGGFPETLEHLTANLQRRWPDLIIAGAESPPYRPLSEDELQDTADRINASGARIVFIGLGCPKQDLFAAHNRESIRGVQICVGAAFDFHAGVKPTAPVWMQRRGLEWLFRLWCEPRRLWRRYVVTNTRFVGKWIAASARQLRGHRPDTL